MTYQEFKRRLGQSGLSAQDFANCVGLNPRSLSNYARGKRVPNHWAIVVTLLAELADRNLDVQEVLSKVKPQPRPKRGRGKPVAPRVTKKTSASQKSEGHGSDEV